MDGGNLKYFQSISNPHCKWIAQARSVRLEDEIARRGICLHGRGPERCGPCPRCGGTNRFAINVTKQVWNCRGCQRGGDVVALVGHLDGLKFLDACRVLMGHEPPGRDKSASGASNQGRSQARSNDEPTAAEYERHQREKAARLWSKHRPMAGSIAERYLRQVRGIKCPLPATLAFLPPFKREHHPAMIAAFAMVDEPEPGVLGKPRNVNCVHLTLLKCDGSGKADAKPNKLIIARPLGRPIVVAPPNDLLGLAITEGIEDALAAHQATGLGAWAASAAGFMPGLADRVPGYIEAATIYAHDDHDGQNGAHRLAKALDPRGIEIRIESLGL